MDPIKAIIFDLDNTLLDRTNTFRSFTKHFVDTYFSHVDTTDEIMERIIEMDQDGYKDKHELFAELHEQLSWNAKPMLSELIDFYSVHYVRNAQFMKHAKEVILHVKNKYKIGLITNGKTAIQYGKIDQLGIRDDFDVIIVSEEAEVRKPNPAIFEMALQKLNLTPEQCIYIGDHPVNDIEGAAHIGIGTIWMKVNQPWKDEIKAKPLYTIESLSELLELV